MWTASSECANLQLLRRNEPTDEYAQITSILKFFDNKIGIPDGAGRYFYASKAPVTRSRAYVLPVQDLQHFRDSVKLNTVAYSDITSAQELGAYSYLYLCVASRSLGLQRCSSGFSVRTDYSVWGFHALGPRRWQASQRGRTALRHRYAILQSQSLRCT